MSKQPSYATAVFHTPFSLQYWKMAASEMKHLEIRMEEIFLGKRFHDFESQSKIFSHI